MSLRLKRAYDDPEPDDGLRILIDRLWPRGVSKDALKLDEWMKKISPSDELRKRFHHDPEKFDEFKKRYFKELDEQQELVEKLLELSRNRTVTLIYAAKDQNHNNAVALKEYLESMN